MEFLEPSEGKKYFGEQAFHLLLKRTTPEMPELGFVPAYYFDMMADGQKVGQCTLRVGYNETLECAGNIGYQVDEKYRGNHYALKACRLLLHLAQRHHMKQVLITCQPENTASQKVCEALHAQLMGEIEIPDNHDLYSRGYKSVLQYRYELDKIVPAREEDIPLIAQLYDELTAKEEQGVNYSGWVRGEYPQESTARELFKRGGLHCIFDEQGKLVAAAAYDCTHGDCYKRVHWSRNIANEQTLCIHTLAVHPDCRKRGLGEKMMRFGFDKARELGLKGIRIDTWVNNLPGLRLYHRLGYRDADILYDNVQYEGDTMAYQFLEWYCDEQGTE